MHRLSFTSTERNAHFGESKHHVEIDGDGGLDHLVNTFKAFAIACGFHPDSVAEALGNTEPCGFGLTE